MAHLIARCSACQSLRVQWLQYVDANGDSPHLQRELGLRPEPQDDYSPADCFCPDCDETVPVELIDRTDGQLALDTAEQKHRDAAHAQAAS
mgnify:CR=1 FL=1